MFYSIQGSVGPQGVQGEQGEQGDPALYNYTYRGDPNTADFVKTDFTWDNAWYDFDLSGIVAAGAILVHLKVRHRGSASAQWFKFRKNGNTEIVNGVQFNSRVAGIDDNYDVWIALDAERKAEYQAGATPTVFEVTVRGWLS